MEHYAIIWKDGGHVTVVEADSTLDAVDVFSLSAGIDYESVHDLFNQGEIDIRPAEIVGR